MNCPQCNRKPQRGDQWVTQTKPRFEVSIVRCRKCPGCGHKWFTAEVPIVCDMQSTDRITDLQTTVKSLLKASYETFPL